jgi:hypothetical protein
MARDRAMKVTQEGQLHAKFVGGGHIGKFQVNCKSNIHISNVFLQTFTP